MMATQEATRDTILDLERKYWDAMKARDGKAATRLTADECIVAGLFKARSEVRRLKSKLIVSISVIHPLITPELIEFSP